MSQTKFGVTKQTYQRKPEGVKTKPWHPDGYRDSQASVRAMSEGRPQKGLCYKNTSLTQTSEASKNNKYENPK